jgi:hypothetical protein
MLPFNQIKTVNNLDLSIVLNDSEDVCYEFNMNEGEQGFLAIQLDNLLMDIFGWDTKKMNFYPIEFIGVVIQDNEPTVILVSNFDNTKKYHFGTLTNREMLKVANWYANKRAQLSAKATEEAIKDIVRHSALNLLNLNQSVAVNDNLSLFT